MNAQHHEHTLNRIVPAMEGGFVIQTAYGDLTIEPGPLANRIRNVVALHAQMALDRQVAQQPTADAQRSPQGFPHNAPVIGEGWGCRCQHHAPELEF